MSSDSGIYHFRAGAPDGGVFTGQLAAGSAEEALKQLRQRGFVPLRLAHRPIRERWFEREVSFSGGKRLSLAECGAFCRELALLLGSGVVVVDAIAIMLPSLRRGSKLKAFATAVRNGLRLGRSLSQAVETSGFALPSDLIPVVRAGEEAASLPAALSMLGESYADAGRFTQIYVSALAYPTLLLLVSVFVLALIAFFVAPSLAGLFVSMERSVPAAIGVLAAASSFAGSNAALLGGAAVAFATAIGLGLSTRAMRQACRRFLCRLPVIGTAMRWSASRRFASTLRLCLASGVPMASALPNALMSAGYPEGDHRMRALLEQVRSGARLSASVERAGILPPKLVHMIAVGESSGRLVEVLAAIVDEARSRFEHRMAMLSALLAPALILVVGALIGTVIFSVFSALLEINEIAF